MKGMMGKLIYVYIDILITPTRMNNLTHKIHYRYEIGVNKCFKVYIVASMKPVIPCHQRCFLFLSVVRGSTFNLLLKSGCSH